MVMKKKLEKKFGFVFAQCKPDDKSFCIFVEVNEAMTDVKKY